MQFHNKNYAIKLNYYTFKRKKKQKIMRKRVKKVTSKKKKIWPGFWKAPTTHHWHGRQIKSQSTNPTKKVCVIFHLLLFSKSEILSIDMFFFSFGNLQYHFWFEWNRAVTYLLIFFCCWCFSHTYYIVLFIVRLSDFLP